MFAPALLAQEKPYGEVGAWKIITAYEVSGKLNRCIAEQKNATGMLRLALAPNNRWALTVPGSLPGFPQKPKTQIWAEVIIADKNGDQMEGQLAALDATAGRTVFANFGRVPDLRRGTKLSIKVFNTQDPCEKCPSKTFSWPLKDVKEALDSVTACVKDKK